MCRGLWRAVTARPEGSSAEGLKRQLSMRVKRNF
jgi:hypothetical protein